MAARSDSDEDYASASENTPNQPLGMANPRSKAYSLGTRTSIEQVPWSHSSIDSPQSRLQGNPPSTVRKALRSFENRPAAENDRHTLPRQQIQREDHPPVLGRDFTPNLTPPGKPASHHEAGRGWGSLGSWINTAVSTVSEVIEHPNVVVSKAQTFGQGIRNVASEQIDRVYESLDPEYEYERERQEKQRQQRQDQEKSLNSGSGNILPTASVPSISGGPNHAEPPVLRVQHPTLPSTMDKTHPKAKLGIATDIGLQDQDGWGDDAWNDNWDDNADPAHDAEDTRPLADPIPTAEAVHIAAETPPVAQHQVIQPAQEKSRDTKALFDGLNPGAPSGKPQPSKQSDLSVPVPRRDSEIGSSGRRPSADMRPAEALFSTLDFASNALGSAVLGVHRKVTQGAAPHNPTPSDSKPGARATSHLAQRPQLKDTSAIEPPNEISEKMDRVGLNPSLDAVSGNVVSTGLGALESLGKKAVDVISDVRRAGHQPHLQGASRHQLEQPDELATFKIPARMKFAVFMKESGGDVHSAAVVSLATDAASRQAALTKDTPKLNQLGESEEIVRLLSPQGLQSATRTLSSDILLGHKDFRAIMALLEKMGVQGTTPLRQLRNSTRRLGSLVQDSVNAFEQEWHNRQSRASERDFFAKLPIQKFFEARLMSIYSDGLKTLAQYTNKTCSQIFCLSESFYIRAAEKAAGTIQATQMPESAHSQTFEPLAVASVLQQFLGHLISEARFVANSYAMTMDAVLQAAKGYTTPLDAMDWEELAYGTNKIKSLLKEQDINEALGCIQSAARSVADILKLELVVDVIQGRFKPSMAPSTRGQGRTNQKTPTPMERVGSGSTALPIPQGQPAAALSKSRLAMQDSAASQGTPHSHPPQSLSRPSSRATKHGKPTPSVTPKPRPVDVDFFSILDENTK